MQPNCMSFENSSNNNFHTYGGYKQKIQKKKKIEKIEKRVNKNFQYSK